MVRTNTRAWLAWVVVCGLAASAAAAQDAANPAAQAAEQIRGAAAQAVQVVPHVLEALTPTLSGATLAWVAAVLILTLTFQGRRVFSWHNLDGLLLAAVCVLLMLRSEQSVASGLPFGQTVQWWVLLALSLVAAYWVLRGLGVFFSRTVTGIHANVSEGAMVVLLLAGLLLSFDSILKQPLSQSSIDGLIGGVCVADTGKLPYGDVPGHDARSPLLYLANAAAVKATQPSFEDRGVPTVVTWEGRTRWLEAEGLSTIDPTPARLVNAGFFLLTVLGAGMIAWRLHSIALAQTVSAILCIFPGALECLNDGGLLLTTAALTWTVALALIPGGSLLSAALCVLAGVANPAAWLLLPLLLAHFARRGVAAFGALLGLAGGAALLVIGVGSLVEPAIPQADRALAAAGIAPTYAARFAESESAIVLEPAPAGEPPKGDFKSFAWRWLIEQDARRLGAITPVEAPSGVDGASVHYRDVTASGPVYARLLSDYRKSFSPDALGDRLLAGSRTLLESTWLAGASGGAAGAWSIWSQGGDEGFWTLVRRIAKVVVTLLALLLAFLLFGGGRKGAHQFAGGAAAVLIAVQLVSLHGALDGWVLLMPAVLAILAAKGEPAEAARPRGIAPPTIPVAPAPRITTGG